MVNLQLKDRENIVERKIRYDSTIEEYQCKLLQSDKRKITLLHQVEKSFEMRKGKQKLVIPKGPIRLLIIGWISHIIYTFGEMQLENI